MDLEINMYSHYHLYSRVWDIKKTSKSWRFFTEEKAGLKVAVLHQLFLLNVYESY